MVSGRERYPPPSPDEAEAYAEGKAAAVGEQADGGRGVHLSGDSLEHSNAPDALTTDADRVAVVEAAAAYDYSSVPVNGHGTIAGRLAWEHLAATADGPDLAEAVEGLMRIRDANQARG